MLGSITCIRGQVTRTTDVRPELIQGAFTCGDCGHIEEGVAQAFKYTQVNPKPLLHDHGVSISSLVPFLQNA